MPTTNPNTGFSTTSSSAGSNGSEGSLNSASASAHSAVNKAASAAQNASSKIKPVIDRVASSAHQAVDKAVGVVIPTADWLSERGHSLKVSQEKMIADARGYVAVNPLKAVGIALAAGLLLGRIMR